MRKTPATSDPMRSCIYNGHVVHHRIHPKEHRFRYSLFMLYLDLDELSELEKNVSLLRVNRSGIFSFRETDHLAAQGESLKSNIMGFIRGMGIKFSDSGRVMLLTLPRVFGYIFNPVCFYFFFDQGETPICCVAEVGNTFHEKKRFLITQSHESKEMVFSQTIKKFFYVSPFSKLDDEFVFSPSAPGEKLSINIDDREDGRTVLKSALTGRQKALSRFAMWSLLLKHPFLTLKVISMIHWEAWRLYRKRVPFFRKAANPELQTGISNPHKSLPQKSSASSL